MGRMRFFRRRELDAEVQQEMELHLEYEITENIEQGMTPAAARRQAYLKFGSPQRVREEVWRWNTVSAVDSFLREMGYVFRRLAKSPSAVLTVVVSLGLGIAANVVIFSGVNKVVLQGPPVGDPTTLLDLYATYNHGRRFNGVVSQQMYSDLHDQPKSFSVAGYDQYLPATVGGAGEPERAWGQSTTDNYFEVVQLPMVLGRGFHEGEEHSPVIVLSNRLWRHHFSGDAGIVGKTMLLSGKMFTVIGVTQPGFRGTNMIIDSQFWIPLGETGQLGPDVRAGGQLKVIARLKPGVKRADAEAELDTMARQFAAAYPKTEEGLGFHTEQAGAMLAEAKAQIMIFITELMVVALLVLCIAGSNVANLLLVRAAARHREMAVRIALGATRFQLIRPMLLESTVLALGGGVFGVALSIAGIRGLDSFQLPGSLPVDLNLSLDWRVLLYAFLLSVGAGLLCGVGPAFAGSCPALPNSLKGESTLERPGRRWSLRGTLVVLQISLCVVLLCTTGLFLRSLQKTAEVNPGFRTDGLLIASIDPVHNGYTAEQTALLLKRLQERVASLPGVMSAAWTDMMPLSMGSNGDIFHVAGTGASAGHDPFVETYTVSAGYFDTMEISFVEGRNLNTVDPKAPKQAVVDEFFARRMFGDKSAIGEHVVSSAATYQIVGVVKNTKARTLSADDEPILYDSLEQNIGKAAPLMGFTLLAHEQGNAAQLAAAIRNEVHEIDPALAVFGEKTIEEHLSDSLVLPRVAAAVFGLFGFAGLLLAAVGLYSVMSYSVSSRMHEIGVRLALGATRGRVQRMVVQQGMWLSCVAVGIGLPIAFAASKVAAQMLYGITPHDWVTFTAVPVFLAVVALAACWFPARRAAMVEPQTALRHE